MANGDRKSFLAILLTDQAGFLVSAELILIAKIAVQGLVVGVSEIATNINNELEDVGFAFGVTNQPYYVSGHYFVGRRIKGWGTKVLMATILIAN